MDAWEAFVIGFVGGLFFIFGSWVLIKIKVDDPVDAIPSHFFAGIWGVISTGIFHRDSGLINTNNPERF